MKTLKMNSINILEYLNGTYDSEFKSRDNFYMIYDANNKYKIFYQIQNNIVKTNFERVE